MTAELSDFLRTRRARLTPAEVGLPDRGRRRVPGLRREEVAQLAGVSTDYYVRLEQGRGTHVSDQVLDAVGRALRLDTAELAHLHALAHPARHAATGPQPVRSSLLHMLRGMDGPALITDYTSTVLAANPLARAVFDITDEPASRDRARRFFLERQSRTLYPDWPQDARSMASELRVQAARRPEDTRLTALIGELSIKSDEFRAIWAEHTVREKTHGRKVLNHPLVGRLELSYDRLTVADDSDASLYVYTAEPGSDSAERLALLASWSAGTSDSPTADAAATSDLQ